MTKQEYLKNLITQLLDLGFDKKEAVLWLSGLSYMTDQELEILTKNLESELKSLQA